jgi:hypothetical protein
MTEALEDYQTRIAELAAELAGVGFMSQGSVVRRHTYCANAGCHCHADPPVPHGPYWQWSRAKGGRTFTRRITAEQAALYKEWIANRRRALGIIAQIEEISEQAGELLLQGARPARSDNPAGARS